MIARPPRPSNLLDDPALGASAAPATPVVTTTSSNDAPHFSTSAATAVSNELSHVDAREAASASEDLSLAQLGHKMAGKAKTFGKPSQEPLNTVLTL